MLVRLTLQTVQIVIRQLFTEMVVNISWDKRIEADARINIRKPRKIDHQRKAAQVFIAVIIALIRPNAVCHQPFIKRQCKRTRTHADNFRGIPVRHDAINGTFTMKVRLDALPGFDLLINAAERFGLLAQVRRRAAQHQRTNL